MRLQHSTAVATLVFLSVGGTSVSAQVVNPGHADSVHFVNACRQASQVVRIGRPEARVAPSLAQLRYCGAEGRTQVIDHWLGALVDPAVSDSSRITGVTTLLGLQDRRLFDGTLAVAMDEGKSFEQRTLAMVVLVAQLKPELWFGLEDLRNIPGVHYCNGPQIVTHIELVLGEPLPPGAASQAATAMESLAARVGIETRLGAAAKCVARTAAILAEP